MATIREKENDFKKVMVCIANWSRAGDEMDKAGKEYVDKYSPFKKGQKIIIEGNKENYGVIHKVDFDRHSNLEGMAKIYVKLYTKNWLQPTRKALLIISDKQLYKNITIVN